MPDVLGPADGYPSAPSGLSDRERDYLAYLSTITILAQIDGADFDAVNDALGKLAERGEIYLIGDDVDVFVVVGGHTIVWCTRQWLRAHAAPPILN